MKKDRDFDADQVSVGLAYFLEDKLGGSEELQAILADPKQEAQLRQSAQDLLNQNRDSLAETLLVTPGVDIHRILSDQSYLARVADMAMQRLRGGPDAPSLRLSPFPLSPEQRHELVGEGINFALVFGAESIYFQDTVQAFHTDEISSRENGDRVNVLGVRHDWLTDDGKHARRALIVDETESVKEVVFQEPVAIQMVETLHLPTRGEQELHRRISETCQENGIPQINPYEDAAERADDKMETHSLWSNYRSPQGEEISSPAAWLISRSNSQQEIVSQLRGICWQSGGGSPLELVIQPNHGTEGQRVEGVTISSQEIDGLTPQHPLIDRMASLLAEDDVLIREDRGNLRFFSDQMAERDKGYRRIAFRVNVAWNGSQFVAESGYAQVAKDEQAVAASRGRGGTIVDFNQALTQLYWLEAGQPTRFVPTLADVARMKAAAVNAAWALNAGLPEEDYLKHLGIDLLLEFDGTALSVLVLEANPRPAGLAQAREIKGMSEEQAQPLVTRELFKYLRRRCGR